MIAYDVPSVKLTMCERIVNRNQVILHKNEDLTEEARLLLRRPAGLAGKLPKKKEKNTCKSHGNVLI